MGSLDSGQILSWACMEWWDLVQNSYLEAMNRKKKKDIWTELRDISFQVARAKGEFSKRLSFMSRAMVVLDTTYQTSNQNSTG